MRIGFALVCQEITEGNDFDFFKIGFHKCDECGKVFEVVLLGFGFAILL